MGYLEGLILLAKIFMESGGPAALKKFFTKNKEELEALHKSLKRPGKSKGWP